MIKNRIRITVVARSINYNSFDLVKWRMKYSEIIANNLSKAGWSWGCVSALDW
jgi:hypothetical protein